MVCIKCGKFNMSQNEVCAFCGEKLNRNPGAASLKGFVGEKSAPPKSEEETDVNVVQFESFSLEEEEEPIEVFEITLPEDIDEIEEVSVCVAEEEELTLKERAKLRNTALLAVGLGVIVSAFLIVISIIIFRGVAGKVVNNKVSDLMVDKEITFTDSGRVKNTKFRG